MPDFHLGKFFITVDQVGTIINKNCLKYLIEVLFFLI